MGTLSSVDWAVAAIALVLAGLAAVAIRRRVRRGDRATPATIADDHRFRNLYRETPLPLHALDADGRIEQVSRTWLELLGYPAAEVIGRPLIDFLTEPSTRQFLREDWPELMTRGALPPRDYTAVTRSGQFIDVLAEARVQRIEGGGRRVLGGLTDITQRRRTEDALRQAQKMEAIGQLTGGVAHDFNNLLAVVVGNLDLIGRRIDAGDQRTLRLVNNAMEGAQRGASLTQRLLAFARRQDLRPEPVDVARLVHGMGDLLGRSLGPLVRVRACFPLDLPAARIDAHQLELALVNLALNARDAMPGGGTVEITASMEVAGGGDGLAAGSYLKLSLADDGCGMEPDTLTRSTEPFFTTKGRGRGTGLGLSMVQGLIAQSGGRFQLRSMVGQGTTAELLLPLAGEAGVTGASRPTAVAPRGAQPNRTVLVVDDDPLVLANTAAMLDDLGHKVVAAGSGMEALARLADQPPFDLLITDQLMPLMTGTQLIERLRAIQPGLPALIVSGFSELAEPVGDMPLLHKPFTQMALADAIGRLLPGAAVIPIRTLRRQA